MATRTDEVLSFIKSYIRRHHRPPTVREIMDGAEISSTSVVMRHLQVLEDRGDITRQRWIARGIRLT